MEIPTQQHLVVAPYFPKNDFYKEKDESKFPTSIVLIASAVLVLGTGTFLLFHFYYGKTNRVWKNSHYAKTRMSVSMKDSNVRKAPPPMKAKNSKPALRALPNITVGSDKSFGTAPLAVNFTSSADSDGKYSYSWDFGDGMPQAEVQNPSHVFNSEGKYTVSLEVTDENGQKIRKYLEVEVSPAKAAEPAETQKTTTKKQGPSAIKQPNKTAAKIVEPPPETTKQKPTPQKPAEENVDMGKIEKAF